MQIDKIEVEGVSNGYIFFTITTKKTFWNKVKEIPCYRQVSAWGNNRVASTGQALYHKVDMDFDDAVTAELHRQGYKTKKE